MSCFYQWAFGIALTMPLLATAQPSGKRPDPVDPDSERPAAIYQSAFAGYQPLQEATEPPDTQWRAVNEEVARVGGHVGIFRDAAPTEAPAPGKGEESRPGSQMMHHKH